MLNVYPTKNLEDFYDKEGYRDEEFDKNDKGTWIINSKMIVEPKGKDMEARGMVLHINRNTRTTKGDFIIKRITEDNKGDLMLKTKISGKNGTQQNYSTKQIKDEKLKRKSKTLNFLHNITTLKT